MSNANNFEIPNWAGKPPAGLHLDVTKDGKLIQKLMCDQKKCYFFGRNKDLSDFHVPHDSCSRVHAALIWHKNLTRPFIVDLGSTHGTFIGHIRLETKKPTQLPPDSEFHFGASTRKYVIRERPRQSVDAEDGGWSTSKTSSHKLPENESELEHLTEYNTAQNRNIDKSNVKAFQPDLKNAKRKLKRQRITFNDEEEVINPEDVDPSVGRFRNLIQTTVIPTKRQKRDSLTESLGMEVHESGDTRSSSESNYHILDTTNTYSTAAKLGISVPNLAPDISPQVVLTKVDVNPRIQVNMDVTDPTDILPKKKKYAKEAWPGKKPAHLLI